MDLDELKRRRAAVVARYGPWTDHNIHLGGDVFTMESRSTSPKWRRILQVVADIAGQPLRDLRVLDLACLEGQYAIEFARHGASVVGIEGREANIAKARFAKEALDLTNLEFCQDDIRNLNAATYGTFDVVLCLGVLYHLDAPDVFEFVDRIAQVCRRFAVFDTYVSLRDRQRYMHNGHTYWGRQYFEHDSASNSEERLKSVWASLDNPRSVWLTRPSLLNLVEHVGFTSAYECHNPAEPSKLRDRITLLAVKGVRQQLLNVPRTMAAAAAEWPEQASRETHPVNQSFGDLSGRITRLVPRAVKRPAKHLLRRLGVRSV